VHVRRLAAIPIKICVPYTPTYADLYQIYRCLYKKVRDIWLIIVGDGNKYYKIIYVIN